MKSLNDLANEFGTDKGTLVGNRHGYTWAYERYFGPLRNDPIRILEIGLSIGGPELGFSADREVVRVPSVEMWLSYFPNGRLTGLDISDCSQFQRDRFDFVRADCGDQGALRSNMAGRQFDLIIDDGSHASFHQQLTLLECFPALRPGGLYVIEDLDWQPPEYENTLPLVPKTTELLARLSMSHPTVPHLSGLSGEAAFDQVKGQIASVELYRRSDLDQLAPKSEPEKLGFFKRLRVERRNRRRGPQAPGPDPVKLAVIRKK